MNEQSSGSLPLVSVVITVYNREKYIAAALESALSQDYENLEIIVSDNASRDNSGLIIGKYLSDDRVKYFRNESNIGMFPNYKLATERASGEYLTYLSSDDYFINDSFITHSVSLINKYENVLLVLGRIKVFYEETKRSEIDKNDFLHKEFINGIELFLHFPLIKTICWGAALMHRKTLLGIAPYDSPCAPIDIMSNLKFMLMGNVGLIDKPSYLQTIHGGNASVNINLQQAINDFYYITEPYEAALKNNSIPRMKLEKWKTDSIFLYVRYKSVQFAAQDPGDYKKFMNYVKENFPEALKKLRLNFKWHVLIFFFKRPAFSLKFLNLFSKEHYLYLKSLVKSE